MSRPRKQTYTLEMYLNKIKDGDISNNADVQRNFVWNKEQINELVFTVLTDDYIPPIILGEEDNSQLHIADGGQRSAALSMFRYGNHKITSSIENSIVTYKKKSKDEFGNVVVNDAEFDIKNKTYEKLPVELKKKFNEYQIETVIHENCDVRSISRYIKRYNNHTSMNTEQKAFTYIDNFAGLIREIINMKFFVDCSSYTEKEKTKGVVERVIVEAVMCSNHLKDWKKQTKSICKFLNDNATKEEFEKLEENLHRLESIITDDIKDIFNSKESFIFLTLFDKFTDLGIEDLKFADFLKEFKQNLRNTKINNEKLLFDQIDKDKGTKDKSVIAAKLDMLMSLMYEFLGVRKEDVIVSGSVLDFVRETVNNNITQDDIDLYDDCLNDLTLNVDNNTKLLDKHNHLSLIAVIAYACEKDIDVDEWFVKYFDKNNNYIKNQRENYLHMIGDLTRFINMNEKMTA